MPGPVQSIERAAAIMRLLARGPTDMALGEIAGSLGLAKPTVYGILRTLDSVGFVKQDSRSGRYRLGDVLAELGLRSIDDHELGSRASNWTDALAVTTGEAVVLTNAEPTSVCIIRHVFRPDDSDQTLRVGEMLPAHATAPGKIALAFDPHALRLLPDDLEPFTARTCCDPVQLRRTLAEVRELGWANEQSEYAVGASAIAAPVHGHGGLVVGAIAVTGPSERINGSGQVRFTELVTTVIEASRAISRDLGADRR